MYTEKNFSALSTTHPVLAERLRKIETNERFEVFMDEKDAANINIFDNKTKTPLYKTIPLEETLATLSSFHEYQRYPYLYFFGIGNGLFYKLLLSNESLTRVVVFEPHLELLYIALHFCDLSEEIHQGRLAIFTTDDVDFALCNTLLSSKDAVIYSKLFELHGLLPYYYHTFHNEFLSINKLLTRAIEHNVYSAGNDATDALIGLEHHIRNIPFIVRSPQYIDFIDALRNTPLAILVSTGPSLAKQLPLLKEIQNHVTIFCVDASMPILEQWGIRPDVVASLERVEATARFYQKTSKKFQQNTLIALTSIVHPVLRESVESENICFSMRPFGYTQFFALDAWGYFGIGMSAANMLFEMIAYSGFNRMLFIGQDLAYGEDGTSHSQGAVYGENEIEQSERDLYVVKYGGEGNVRTTPIWKLFLNFFEHDIDTTKNVLEAINCTEGGARIGGTQELSFHDAIEKYVDKSLIKKKIIPSKPSLEVTKNALLLAKESITEMETYGNKVKTEVEELFVEVQKMTEIFEKLNKENKLEEINFDKVSTVINKINTIKEYFHEPKFVQIFHDVVKSMVLHQELELAKLQVRDVKNTTERDVKLIEWIYAHRDWLFILAAGMDAVLIVIERSKDAILTDPLLNND